MTAEQAGFDFSVMSDVFAVAAADRAGQPGRGVQLVLALSRLRAQVDPRTARSGLSVRTVGSLERGRTTKPNPRSIRLLTSTLGLPKEAANELIAQCRTGRDGESAPSALAAYVERRGHWPDYVASQTIALAAAERAGDLAGQASAHYLLGRASSRTGSHQNAYAHLRHALDLYRKLGDRTGQAHTHHSLGWMFGQQHRHREALHHAHQSFALYQAAGHRTGQARTLNTLGWYRSLLGMHQEALTYCQQALDLHRELGNHDGEADALDSLGHAHHHLGHPTDAITCYQQALDLFHKLGDRHQQAETLGRLANAHHAAGDHAAARETWNQALAILDDLHHPDADKVRARLVSLREKAQHLAPSRLAPVDRG